MNLCDISRDVGKGGKGGVVRASSAPSGESPSSGWASASGLLFWPYPLSAMASCTSRQLGVPARQCSVRP